MKMVFFPEGYSTDNEQRLGQNSEMFLTRKKPTVAEGNDFDFNEIHYNNVLGPENSYSSCESQVDNNEKKEKKKASNKRGCFASHQ